jgi:predicted ATPase
VLRRVGIDGVRGLARLELELGALTALIGPRNSGKSQLLGSLAWLSGAGSPPAGDAPSITAEVETPLGPKQFERRMRTGKRTSRRPDGLPVATFLRARDRLMARQRTDNGLLGRSLATRMGGSITSDAAAAEALIGAVEECCSAGIGGELVLIEEPELMLMPQAQRYLASLLRTLAESGNQVVYSTRSPAFVDASHAQEIVRLDLQANGSVPRRTPAKPLTDEQRLRLAAEFDHERSEMFFARCVILAEGRTERFALPLVFHALGHDLDAEGISMVEVGGKANLPLLAGVLRDLGIPCVVVHDTDRGRDPRLDALIEAAVGADRVVRLAPDFEAVAGIRRRDDKVLAAWRRFSGATPADVPAPLRRMVELAVATAGG